MVAIVIETPLHVYDIASRIGNDRLTTPSWARLVVCEGASARDRVLRVGETYSPPKLSHCIHKDHFAQQQRCLDQAMR